MPPLPTGSPSALRLVATDIKIAHSIFAMPFAILAAFMAAMTGPEGAGVQWARFGGQLVLIVLAMVFARSVAMLANRLLDREIDARNARTAERALPSGRLSARKAFAFLMVSALLFLTVCTMFGVLYGNWWPSWLGAPVLVWISAYALLKRFTALCHLYLGSSLAISPLAAALAIDPAALAQQPSLWLLSGMVLCWVAGFDIIYALQDMEVDRKQGLFSMPSRLGPGGAMVASRLLHVGAVLCLVGVAWFDPRLRLIFIAGVAIVALLLVYEHATIARWGTSRVALVFFTLNGVISCVLGGLGSLDLVLR